MIDATDDPDQTKKLKVLFWQIYQFLEEVIFKQIQLQNKLVPFRENFVPKHIKQARECKSKLDIHLLPYIGKVMQQKSKAQEGNAVQAMHECESYNSYQTVSFYQFLKECKTEKPTTFGRQTRKVSETKRMVSENLERRIWKLNWSKIAMGTGTVLKTKIRAKMKSNKVKTKHQLLEQERKLEHKMKRTALENNDIRSQSKCLLNKSSFNWNPKIKDVSDGTSRIDNLQTPDRPTALIEGTSDHDRFVASPNIKIHSAVTRRWTLVHFPKSWFTI